MDKKPDEEIYEAIRKAQEGEPATKPRRVAWNRGYRPRPDISPHSVDFVWPADPERGPAPGGEGES